MKIVFFGTSDFAARIYAALVERGITPVAVVTKPDKPKGRSGSSSPPPLKEAIERLTPTLPIHQPVKASTPEFEAVLRALEPDLFVVVAYGEIIKENLLSLPPRGCINIHASLLPKYRGAAPIHRALLNGEKESGVTIMKMVLALDAGDMLAVAKVAIPPEMTFGELDQKLSEVAVEPLIEVIRKLEEGALEGVPQKGEEVTFAPKLTPQEERVDWQRSAEEIHNQVRALSPRPGAWCEVVIHQEKKRLKIKRSRVVAEKSEGNWVVACGKGWLELLEVQLEGKRAMQACEFLRGYPGIELNPPPRLH